MHPGAYMAETVSQNKHFPLFELFLLDILSNWWHSVQ